MKRSSVTIDAPAIDLSRLPLSYVHLGELDILCDLARSVSAKTVVEFGCNNGRTAAAILRNVAGIEKYIGVDVPLGYVTPCKVQLREVPSNPGQYALADPRFSLVLRQRGTFDLSPSDFPTCDLVFIDGDHSEAAVRNDHDLARSILRPGGLIVYHDDNGLRTVDVSRVLDDLHDNGADIRHVSGTWLAYERV